MNKNNKKYIIVAAVILIIIVIIIIVIKNKNKNYVSYDELKDEGLEYVINNNNIITKITDFSNIGTIKTCLQIYYQSFIMTNPENIKYATIIDGDSEYYQNKLYNILSEDYKQKNSINKADLKYDKVITDFNVEILSMYKVSKYEEDYNDFGNVDAYIVKGIFRNLDDKSSKKFTILIALDNINRNFEIWPSDFTNISEYENLKPGDSASFEIPNSIPENEYNKFSTGYTSMDDLGRLEFNTIVDLMLYDTEEAYSLLSQDGKSEYASLSQLKDFVIENKSELAIMNYSSSTMELKDSNLILKCYDSNYKYKITINFDEFSTFSFSIEKIK